MAEMTRTDALVAVDAAFPTDPIVVNVGAAIREMVAAVGYKKNHLHILDSMGLPPAIGLGLAMGLADSRFGKVVTIEGDGGLLMGFSALTTIGMLKPEKMILVILDNGTYGSTGHQPTAAHTTDFAGVARACGMLAHDVDTVGGLEAALEEAKGVNGPVLIRARINLQGQKTDYFLHDPVVLADTFQKFLSGAASA
ncbi:MAG: phosphonopyruvate decarboxylase [Chloroflexi bacterium]|nr:phosphonopyruvate decarboxylase [Chloroflexota bacterium]